MEAMVVLDGLAEMYPHHSLVDDILFRKAKIEIEQQNYTTAAELLEQIVDGFAYDLLGDDATFLLAELYNYNLGKQEQAKDLYRQMLAQYPGSVFIGESREKYRVLRQQYPDENNEEETPEDLFMKGTITPDEF
jgi:tetratricopeptide (TPR) repeat protein